MADRWFLSGNEDVMNEGVHRHGLDDLTAYLVHTWQSDPNLFDSIPCDIQVDFKHATICVRNAKEWRRTNWSVWRKQTPDFYYAAFVYWSYQHARHTSCIRKIHDLTLQFVGLQNVYQKAQDFVLQMDILLPDLARIVGHYLALP